MSRRYAVPTAQPTAAASTEPGNCESASWRGIRYDVDFDVSVILLDHNDTDVFALPVFPSALDAGPGFEDGFAVYGAILYRYVYGIAA